MASEMRENTGQPGKATEFSETTVRAGIGEAEAQAGFSGAAGQAGLCKMTAQAVTKIKLCGLSRPEDIEAANSLKPDFIGFVFAPGSKRYVSPERAAELRALLSPGITAAGVFVDEDPETIAGLEARGIIDVAQLHGTEDEDYIKRLKALTGKPVIKAFRVRGREDIAAAQESSADYVLLDSGAGTGTAFPWELAESLTRPYFLAGGLSPDNVAAAIRRLRPFAVDVSSGIETNGKKDPEKMAAFTSAARREEGL